MAQKILVVDDSITARRQVIEAIAESGFEIVEAANGEEGLLRFKTDPEIALIVSDVNMPVMDGIDMAAAVRQTGATLPIILVTTESTQEQIDRGKAAGITGWLVKPFNPNHLRAAVKKATAA